MKNNIQIVTQYLIIFTVFITGNVCYSVTKYTKNPHVQIQSKIENKYYVIDYTFKDQWDEINNIEIKFPVENTNIMANKFGIPNSMFDSYVVSEENIRKRRKILDEGLFIVNGETIEADKDAILNYYSPNFCKPIANYVIKVLKNKDKDSRYNRIEFAMKFVQDIPYGIPDESSGNIYNGGILTPPEILINGYGDCDSKAILFAGIMAYLINPNDIVFVGQTNHVLTAINEDMTTNRISFEMEGENFVIAETAGPGRPRFGVKQEIKEFKIEIEEIEFIHENNFPPADKKDDWEEIKYYYFDHHTVYFKNSTDEDIGIKVYYLNDNNKWVCEGYYLIKPDECNYFIKTKNRVFYYLAKSSEKEWVGDLATTYFGGENKPFIDHRMEKEYYHKETIILR